MELKQYLRLLWRWSWLLVLLMSVAGTAAYVLSKRSVPIYKASTTLMINLMAANGATVDLNALRTSEELAGTYVALLRKRPVMEAVIANFSLNTSPDRLAKNVKVSLVPNTQLIVVTVEDIDPRVAADIANEVVRVFSQQNRELQASRYAATKQNLQQELLRIQADIDNTRAKLDALNGELTPVGKVQRDQLRLLVDQHRVSYTTVLKSYEQVRVTAAQTLDNLNVVEPAQPETVPISPKIMLNMLVAILVAAMIGVGLVYLFAYLDDSVKSSEELEKIIGVPTLATITRIDGSNPSDKLIVATDRRSPIAESYRMLRTNIDFATVDSAIRTLVVTSSRSGEGKSVTAANLSIALAQTGKRVILVDADLRRPSIHNFPFSHFAQDNMLGVTTALLRPHDDPISNHMVPSGLDNLQLMPSGPLPPNPAELLGSQRMAALLEDLRMQADVVIFDTPPLMAVADGSLLAHVCDATLLVVLAGSTRLDALRFSKDQLLQSGARLLGTVFNCVSSGHVNQYQTYYSIEKPRKQYVRWRRWPFRWERSRSTLDSPKSAALQAIVEVPHDYQGQWGHNGNTPAIGVLPTQAVIDMSHDYQGQWGYNGNTLAAAVLPTQAVVDMPIEERPDESAIKQGTLSATPAVAASSTANGKRMRRVNRPVKRSARRSPKTTR